MDQLERASVAAADLELPPAVFKTCPWQPRELIETGLRQWLRCCAAGLRDKQVIGMPSHAVDEAWHGLILCTARYAAFCTRAYGQFLHHHPEGGAPADVTGANDPAHEQLRRTVIAWSTGREARRGMPAVGSRPARRRGPPVGARCRQGGPDSGRDHRTPGRLEPVRRGQSKLGDSVRVRLSSQKCG